MDLSTIMMGVAVVVMGVTLFYQVKSQKQIESNFDRDTEMLKAQAKEFLEMESYSLVKSHILFLLSDLMHDNRVFERFTKQEINDIFLQARKLTADYAGRDASVVEYVAFSEYLEQEIWPKRYPSWGEFSGDQVTQSAQR